MLTVMALSAAREGALLPGRKGNRVRLGREGNAVTTAFTAPSLAFYPAPHSPTHCKRGGFLFPTRTQNSSTSLPSSLGTPCSDTLHTTSSVRTFCCNPSRYPCLCPCFPQCTRPLLPLGLQGAGWLAIFLSPPLNLPY